MDMKQFLFATLIFLSACSTAQLQTPTEEEVIMPTVYPASLPDLGLAPELTNETWLNTSAPLRLADLRGQVVALEMWTFACYNCKNVIPSLKEWHAEYANQGLVIIGNHYPEFDFEADLSNLKAAIADYGIEYAIAQDNDGATWRAYNNHYWPVIYLIDKQGHIRYVHIGEGRYAETETAIQTLLAENYP
jgi:thiol-disulfide isomerase/thioredoxin